MPSSTLNEQSNSSEIVLEKNTENKLVTCKNFIMKYFCIILIIGVCFISTYTSYIIESQSPIIISVPVNKNNVYENEPQCDSKIYCHGELLHTVQMAHIYPDSKTFVDMKIKTNPEDTLNKFDEFMKKNNNTPSKENVQIFVETNFEKPGSEFEKWTPTDWKEHPKLLDNIKDVSYKQWANDLNHLWLDLGRKMTADVGAHPEQYSIIPVTHPVIVPGGRFREFYYWDSYWIVRGLLLSEMHDTVKGMLENFLSIITTYGFIPNGGRVYYSKRSQPPLLSAMIKSYVETTKDIQFAKDNVEILEKEFNFWMNEHTIEVNGHMLSVYGDKSLGPRPESYREDIETSSAFKTDEEKEEHYSELKAAAESGMDFSSRWFINENGTNKGDLTNLKCRSIVPVELNAILYWNAKIISEFYELKGNLDKSAEFEAKALDILQGIQSVLWHDDIGAWLDYDLINNQRREYFSPTNLAPLWMKCYEDTKIVNMTEKILSYIKKVDIDRYPGGVPNSLESTGEQWDFPNVWPPMQYLLIFGLKGINDSRTIEIAHNWAERWVLSNFIAYKDTQAMFEKYSAEELGGHGKGGEYDVQLGFGWTNGVIMELLDVYGSQFSPGNTTETDNGNGKAVSVKLSMGAALTSLVGVLVTAVLKVFG